jgi:aminoglycoside phosphotransferase
MPAGFFRAVEPDAPVISLLDRLRPAVSAEIERYAGADATVHAELRTGRGADGEVEMRRFYWSTQQPDPASPWGFAARTLYCQEDAAGLQVHEFPSEPALPWLADADGPLRRDGRAERVDVLRYIPLRRLTYRLHDGAGLPERVIAKSKRTGGLNRAAVAFLAVNQAAGRRSAAPRVPRLLRLEPPRHALYLEELPGRPLHLAISGLDVTDAMQHLGGLHRSLQELEVKGLPVRRAADWLEEARVAVDRIGLFVPSAAAPAAAVLDDLVRTAPDDDSMLFCQGDFLPGQILCHESGWSVIDLDDSRYADPLSDVAAMYVGMARELGLPDAQAEHARRTYLEAYAARAGEAVDRKRWRWYLTLLQLNELGKRLMKGRVAPGETAAVLDRLTSPDDGLG